jgi:hypothetical protein
MLGREGLLPDRPKIPDPVLEPLPKAGRLTGLVLLDPVRVIPELVRFPSPMRGVVPTERATLELRPTLGARVVGTRSTIGDLVVGVRLTTGARVDGVRPIVGARVAGTRLTDCARVAGARPTIGERDGDVRLTVGERVAGARLTVGARCTGARPTLDARVGVRFTVGVRPYVVLGCRPTAGTRPVDERVRLGDTGRATVPRPGTPRCTGTPR